MAQEHRITAQLRKLIKESGMTQYRIGKMTGIDKATLSRFMSGDRGMHLDNIDAIAELLKVKLTAGDSRKGR